MVEINEVIGQVKKLQKTQKEAQLDLSKFKGKLEQEMERLKKDYGLETLGQVNKEVEKLHKRLQKIDEQILSKFDTLKENYDVSA